MISKAGCSIERQKEKACGNIEYRKRKAKIIKRFELK
jgi:hypothetical protein